MRLLFFCFIVSRAQSEFHLLSGQFTDSWRIIGFHVDSLAGMFVNIERWVAPSVRMHTSFSLSYL